MTWLISEALMNSPSLLERGGGILASHLLGWRTICAVEWEAYPASVLLARQNDGFLPPFPIWDDVQTFDGKPWRGIVDVISGGFPCQDISAAGKGAGITGERSGMWKHMARIIGEVRPQYVFVENSPMLTSRGLGTVLGDLASMGFDAEWGVLSANNVGAPHLRERIWILASDTRFKRCDNGLDHREKRQVLYDIDRDAKKSKSTRQRRISGIGKIGEDVANTTIERCKKFSNSTSSQEQANYAWWSSSHGKPKTDWWESEPEVGRMADGVASRVDRLKAIGNGQVPLCAATAFKLLKERLHGAG